VAIAVKALPKLSGLLLSPARFRAAHTGNSVTKSTSLGTNVRYKLSIAAAVRFTIQRATDGRLVGARCVAPARTNRKARHCMRFVTVRGSFTMTGRAGKNNFRFSGRLNGSALAPGNYRLVATPTVGGSTGSAVTTGFTILR
jgi:phage terminase large subunit-like protein